MADVAGSFSLLRMAVALYPSNKIQCLWPGVHSPWQRCCLSYILLGCAACFRSPSGPPRRVRNAQSFAHALGTPTNAARRMATPPSISPPISLCCSIAPATTLRVHSTLGNGSAGGMLLSQRRIEPATSVCVECYQTCNPRYLASAMGKRSAFFRHTVGDCACSCQVSSRSVSTSRQTYAASRLHRLQRRTVCFLSAPVSMVASNERRLHLLIATPNIPCCRLNKLMNRIPAP
jgi:hypothetical protein